MLSILILIGQEREREIKVYIDARDLKQTELYGIHLQTWMKIRDIDDESYSLIWSEKAIEADFILTIYSEKDPETGKFLAVALLQKRGDISKTYETLNIQLNRDLDKIAEIASVAFEAGMGIKK